MHHHQSYSCLHCLWLVHVQVQLREILTARGAGFTYSSAYKIEHDIEQLKYIAEKYGGDKASEIRTEVLPKYEALLAKIPPLEDLQRIVQTELCFVSSVRHDGQGYKPSAPH